MSAVLRMSQHKIYGSFKEFKSRVISTNSMEKNMHPVSYNDTRDEPVEDWKVLTIATFRLRVQIMLPIRKIIRIMTHRSDPITFLALSVDCGTEW